MKNTVFLFVILTSLFSGQVFAATTAPALAAEIPENSLFDHFDLTNQDKSWGEPKWKDGKVASAAPGPSKDLGTLQQLDLASDKGQALLCVSSARIAETRVPELRPWILRRELICLENAAKANKATAAVPPSRIWARIWKIVESSKYFENGPWAEPLRQQWKTTALAWVDFQRRHNQATVKNSVDQLLNYADWLNASEKARCFGILGDRAFLKQNLEAAKFYLDRSLSLEENGENRSRLLLVEASLAKRSAKDKTDEIESPPATQLTDESAKERDLDLRLANSLKSNDAVAIVEDGIELITQFPNGTRAKFITDKIYENFATLADKSDPRYELAHNRMMTALKKADGARLQKWSQAAYRSGLYADSGELADAALKKAVEPNFATKLLWLAGRGAQQSGNLKEAEVDFKKIVDTNTGSDEYVDALTQLGLLSLQHQDWATAISYLERATLKPRDTTKDLTAKYWLWRALQKTDPARAKTIAVQLSDRYPLSYYGLRARSELADGELKWPLYPEIPRTARIYTSPAERQGFSRLQKLYEVGWWEEAQAELRVLPDGAQPIARALMVKVAAAVFDFPRAISQFNKLLEGDQSLAQESFLKAVYPRTFFPIVQQEAQLRKLDPLLVLSLMRQESAFNPKATSTSGALGLMQMIPPTIKDVQQLLKVHTLFLPDDMFEPRRNIQFCTFYLGRVLNEFDGTIPLAIASYNAGPARLKRWIQSRGVPVEISNNPMSDLWMDQLPWDETQFYVKAILRNWVIYRLLDGSHIDLRSPFWLSLNKPAVTP